MGVSALDERSSYKMLGLHFAFKLDTTFILSIIKLEPQFVVIS